jgi:hypothetical protein
MCLFSTLLVQEIIFMNRKLLCLFFSIITISLNSFAFKVGDNWEMPETKNQHDEIVNISSSTKLILFAADREPASLLADYLVESKHSLESSSAVYVSDISKMPGFITKMIAIPKMKKYPFKIGLDREGEVTKHWPREPGALTVFQLSDKKIIGIKFIKTKEEIIEVLRVTP